MSELFKSGYHPDADQICAFVEHALPAHEQEQMLDHLAVCLECREIVALSLPEVEEPARPLPAPARKTWWAGWNLAWSSAVAIASLAVLAIYIHHVTVGPITHGPTEVAGSHLPEPATSQVQSSAPNPSLPLRGTPAQPANGRHSIASGAATVGEQQNADSLAGKNIAPLPIQGRKVAPLDQRVQASPAVPAQGIRESEKRATESNASIGRGVISGLAMAPSAGSELRAQKAAPPMPAGTAIAAAPEAPTSAAKAPASQGSQTTVATTAAPIETVPSNAANIDATIDEAQVAQFAQLRHALPSHLPVLSMATQSRRTVAIDTRNQVFVSMDDGKHWQAIHPPWLGRAVKAALVVHPIGSRAGYGIDKAAVIGSLQAGVASSPGTANDALTRRERPVAATAGSSLKGTVTDRTGAVIPGASVTVTDPVSHAARSVKTDSAGRYLVEGLSAGSYKVEAQASGFMSQMLPAIGVTASEQTVANLSLTVGAASETVKVEADSVEISGDRKMSAKSKASLQPTPVFEITTDNGDRWTSTDGVTWVHM